MWGIDEGGWSGKTVYLPDVGPDLTPHPFQLVQPFHLLPIIDNRHLTDGCTEKSLGFENVVVLAGVHIYLRWTNVR
jgi:hypothetical protein